MMHDTKWTFSNNINPLSTKYRFCWGKDYSKYIYWVKYRLRIFRNNSDFIVEIFYLYTTFYLYINHLHNLMQGHIISHHSSTDSLVIHYLEVIWNRILSNLSCRNMSQRDSGYLKRSSLLTKMSICKWR